MKRLDDILRAAYEAGYERGLDDGQNADFNELNPKCWRPATFEEWREGLPEADL